MQLGPRVFCEVFFLIFAFMHHPNQFEIKPSRCGQSVDFHLQLKRIHYKKYTIYHLGITDTLIKVPPGYKSMYTMRHHCKYYIGVILNN